MRPVNAKPFTGRPAARQGSGRSVFALWMPSRLVPLLLAALLLAGCSNDNDSGDGVADETPTFRREILGRSAGALESPLMVAIDPQSGVIHVYDGGFSSNARVVRFDENGQPLPGFGPGSAFDDPSLAYGIRAMKATAGQLQVLSNDGRLILVMDAAGELIRTFVVRPAGDEARSDVVDFVPSPDDGVYVLDRGLMQIRRYDLQGAVVAQWGRRGTHPDEFERPTLIDLDTAGNPLIFDADLRRIQRFTPAGALLAAWTVPVDESASPYRDEIVEFNGGEVVVIGLNDGPVRLTRYSTGGALLGDVVSDYEVRGLYVDSIDGIDFGPDARLHLLNRSSNQLARIDPDGRLFDLVGHALGSRSGEFRALRGIAAAEDGRFCVTTLEGAVNLYSRTGEPLYSTHLDSGSPYFYTLRPTAAAFGPGGDVHVILESSGEVARISPEGAQLGRWSFDVREILLRFRAERIAVDRVGRVILLGSNYLNRDQLRTYTPTGELLSTVDLPEPADGEEYFANVDVVLLDRDVIGVVRSDGVLLRFDARMSLVDRVPLTGSSGFPLRAIYAIAIENPWGQMMILDRSQDRIARFYPNGAWITDLVPPASGELDGDFSTVFAVAAGAPGQVCLALNDRIWIYEAE